ncbi:hypothetical protein CL3_19370 [butyrate-producing bacterium SM4/1]|nr:hypothetical protein CLS_30670 [[Clostridium] cf. saccharolyticum K10]CBL36360.1 hypothetical protein CL3_19370 [butyrate-producing bacterium SM4/1]
MQKKASAYQKPRDMTWLFLDCERGTKPYHTAKRMARG